MLINSRGIIQNSDPRKGAKGPTTKPRPGNEAEIAESATFSLTTSQLRVSRCHAVLALLSYPGISLTACTMIESTTTALTRSM